MQVVSFATSFRPLIGVNFCKLVLVLLLVVLWVHVSVPLSGLTSVNFIFYFIRERKNCFRPLIGVNFCKHTC